MLREGRHRGASEARSGGEARPRRHSHGTQHTHTHTPHVRAFHSLPSRIRHNVSLRPRDCLGLQVQEQQGARALPGSWLLLSSGGGRGASAAPSAASPPACRLPRRAVLPRPHRRSRAASTGACAGRSCAHVALCFLGLRAASLLPHPLPHRLSHVLPHPPAPSQRAQPLRRRHHHGQALQEVSGAPPKQASPAPAPLSLCCALCHAAAAVPAASTAFHSPRAALAVLAVLATPRTQARPVPVPWQQLD